jgi:hypothetical protein
MGKSELDPVLRGRLDAFREKCKAEKLVKFWSDAKELPGLVAVSLQKTIKTHPAIGWVRANQVANAEILNELNEVRKRNQELENRLRDLLPAVENIAGLDENVELSGIYRNDNYYGNRDWRLTLTWGELFAAVAPTILSCPNDAIMETKFDVIAHDLLKKRDRAEYSNWTEDPQDFQTFKVQMMALKLVDVSMKQTTEGGLALFWSLTELGEAVLLQLRAQKKAVKGAKGA